MTEEDYLLPKVRSSYVNVHRHQRWRQVDCSTLREPESDDVPDMLAFWKAYGPWLKRMGYTLYNTSSPCYWFVPSAGPASTSLPYPISTREGCVEGTFIQFRVRAELVHTTVALLTFDIL